MHVGEELCPPPVPFWFVLFVLTKPVLRSLFTLKLKELVFIGSHCFEQSVYVRLSLRRSDDRSVYLVRSFATRDRRFHQTGDFVVLVFHSDEKANLYTTDVKQRVFIHQ